MTTNMGAPADFHDTVGIDSVSPGQSVTGTLAFKYIYVGDSVTFGLGRRRAVHVDLAAVLVRRANDE